MNTSWNQMPSESTNNSLTLLEKNYLEDILTSDDGYVLNFSDKTFMKFFLKYDIAIHDRRYHKYGTSKAKKLRAFWDLESDETLAPVLSELLDVYEDYCKQKSLEVNQKHLNKCRATVSRIKGDSGKIEESISETTSLDSSPQTAIQVSKTQSENPHELIGEQNINVFISYSHDDKEHKEWVKQLAIRLRNDGIAVKIDFFDLRLGQDLPKFMESGLTGANRVIAICSENYVKKADNLVGGVGYEKSILSAELMKNTDSNKVIPVIRNNTQREIDAQFP